MKDEKTQLPPPSPPPPPPPLPPSTPPYPNAEPPSSTVLTLTFVPSDPSHPRNWPPSQKWTATLSATAITFISPFASSMVAPALPAISEDLSISGSATKTLVLSIFMLGYALGPLVLGPIAELHGRRPVLLLSNLGFLVFNLGCGFSGSTAQIIVLRFLAGVGGSAPLAAGGAVIGDCWDEEVRGRPIAAYTLAIVLGPVLGPVVAGFVVLRVGWRWVFWATSGFDALVLGAAGVVLRETCAGVLLRRRAEGLRREEGGGRRYVTAEGEGVSLGRKLGQTITRATRMLLVQPIVQVMGSYMAFQYGVYYIVLSTFAGVWTSPDHYHTRLDIAGLHYISIGIGYLIGNVVFAYTSDRIYQRLQAASGVGCPEYRLPLLIPGSILIPSGLLIYGWAAQFTVYWVVTDLGALVFSIGGIIIYQGIQAYIIQCCGEYAASGLAATAFIRSLAACTFPLFAQSMYSGLGYGWANTLLALVSLTIGLPSVIGLWIYGSRIRETKTFRG